MKFIDTASIKLKAGKGGDGAISFRREKYVPKGGPNGGNGGSGASIYFIGDKSRHTLMDFRYKSVYKGENGENGKGRDMHGKAGQDLILPVPLGTIIKNAETGDIIADITHHQEKVLAAKGGRGGKGNMCFTTPEQRAPRYAEEGSEGEELEVELELKLLADVGIIGFPNAGKSTFISVVSAAKPKIADYPFTTLTPNLGVIKDGHGGSFVIADMPGLIENAHTGAGLGQQFLRHIERTAILLHFIDSSSEESMIKRYETIKNELKLYNSGLENRKEIVTATKMDACCEENMEEFKKYADKNNLKLFQISSITHDGTKELIEYVGKEIEEYRKNNENVRDNQNIIKDTNDITDENNRADN